MTTISDSDYRSHELPCYPGSAREQEALIRDMENRVVIEITDFDYSSSKTPLFLIELQVAA